jgi:hypothetical protein
VTRRYVLLALAGLAVLLLGFWGVEGPPRLTLSNTGLGIDYPTLRALAALAAAAGAAALAVVVPRRALGVAAVVAAAAFSIFGLHRLVFRLGVGQGGLFLRDLSGSRRMAWRDVTRVEPQPHTLELLGHGPERLEIDTSSFTAEQRASLERTIARRVKEAQPPAP